MPTSDSFVYQLAMMVLTPDEIDECFSKAHAKLAPAEQEVIVDVGVNAMADFGLHNRTGSL